MLAGVGKFGCGTRTQPRQIPQGLFFEAGDAHLDNRTNSEHLGQHPGVTSIGFDAVSGSAQQFRRRRDHTVDARSVQVAGQNETGRAGLIDNFDTRLETANPLQNHGRVSGHRVDADFTGDWVQRMADDVDRVNIQANESMLKHSRDLPNLTCGTTIALPAEPSGQESC
jgi:hypothetical protein